MTEVPVSDVVRFSFLEWIRRIHGSWPTIGPPTPLEPRGPSGHKYARERIRTRRANKVDPCTKCRKRHNDVRSKLGEEKHRRPRLTFGGQEGSREKMKRSRNIASPTYERVQPVAVRVPRVVPRRMKRCTLYRRTASFPFRLPTTFA